MYGHVGLHVVVYVMCLQVIGQNKRTRKIIYKATGNSTFLFILFLPLPGEVGPLGSES